MKQRTRSALFLSLVLLSSTSVDFSYGWVTSSSTASSSASASASAKFYKSPADLSEDSSAAQAFFPGVDSPPSSTSPESETLTSTETLTLKSKLPWMKEDGSDSSSSSSSSNNVYLSHWNWQLSYFQEHLTNLRVNENSNSNSNNNNDNDDDDESNSNSNSNSDTFNNLYNLDDGKEQRVYTISLQSDEYRDIRMTYMHFPGAQIFRCLSYPRNGNLPIMGMGLMKFGIGSGGKSKSKSKSKNMAVMDYQPLPPPPNSNNNNNNNNDDQQQLQLQLQQQQQHHSAVNDLYTSELLRLRAEIPSMTQPMTHQHFDSDDERKYFTESPLLGRWSDGDDDASEQHRRDLQRAQRDYVQTHIELTQRFSGNNNIDNDNDEDEDNSILLKLHSDFDTHVSEKEPAGKFLCSAFGPEIGNKLVHTVIFPLSTVQY